MQDGRDALAELWPDDSESISTLAEIFGYIVCGETSLQKIFGLVGPNQVKGRWRACSPDLKELATISDARPGTRTDSLIAGSRREDPGGETVGGCSGVGYGRDRRVFVGATPDAVANAMTRAYVKAKIAHFHPHDLRHR